MALATLTEVVETTDSEGNVSEFELILDFNATISQVGSQSVDATSQPVERIGRAKSSITDHISVNPNKISLDVVLSNYDDETIKNFSNEDEVLDVVDDKLKQLETWKDDGALLRYDGHNRIDSGVIIIDMGDSFKTGFGEAISLKLTLFKIRIAEAQTATLNAPREVRNTQKLGKQDKKVKQIPTETKVESEENKSFWSSLFG